MQKCKENEIKVSPSDNQIETLVSHSLGKGPLIMVDGERERLAFHVKKNYPNSRIVSAHLDTYEAVWIVKIQTADVQTS